MENERVFAFLSREYSQINSIQRFLSKVGIDAIDDFCIGYKCIKVMPNEYEKTLTYASVYCMQKGLFEVYWASPKGKRSGLYLLAKKSKQRLLQNQALNKEDIEKLTEAASIKPPKDQVAKEFEHFEINKISKERDQGRGQ